MEGLYLGGREELGGADVEGGGPDFAIEAGGAAVEGYVGSFCMG